ncbi:cytochrome P450 [Thozetella sp. PMI_491]|nr:cytochrome P450 [Thozetella sp. PMI_491]
MDSLVQYAVCIITLFLLALGSRLVSNPLKAYPGPLLARITHGYAGWHAIKGDVHLVTYLNHLKYAPNRLVFNTLTALQDIYLNPLISKPQIYAFARFKSTPSVFTELGKADHRRRRKAVGQAISDRSMREFEPTMISQIDIFLMQLLRSSQRGQVVEMSSRCKWLGMDIIALLAFGSSWKTQTEETFRICPRAFAALNNRVYLFMNWPRTHKIDPGVQWLAKGHIEKFRRILAGMISDRMALPRDAMPDLFSFVASDETIDQAQQEGIRKSEIWGEAGVFVNAGGTTTATAICTALHYLSQDPSAYARLASEVRGTFSSGREIRHGQQLNSCKYLRAVLDESMRLSPPTPGVMWREKDPFSTEALVVDSHVIPPGTLVGVGVYSLMHNPDYFPDPFAFHPERWLEGDAETPEEMEARATMRRAFIPFMVGDRSCAGKAMAYLETSLTVAKTIWYFDFKRPPGRAGQLGNGRKGATGGRHRPGEYQLYDRFMSEHEGPNLIFSPREKYWEEIRKN